MTLKSKQTLYGFLITISISVFGWIGATTYTNLIEWKTSKEAIITQLEKDILILKDKINDDKAQWKYIRDVENSYKDLEIQNNVNHELIKFLINNGRVFSSTEIEKIESSKPLPEIDKFHEGKKQDIEDYRQKKIHNFQQEQMLK